MRTVLACAQLPDYFEFKADIPGQSKDKISVTVDGHRLHIAVVSLSSRSQTTRRIQVQRCNCQKAELHMLLLLLLMLHCET